MTGDVRSATIRHDETSGGEDEGRARAIRHARWCGASTGAASQEEAATKNGGEVEDAADGEEAEGVEERLGAGAGCRCRSGCARGAQRERRWRPDRRESWKDGGIEDGGGVELAQRWPRRGWRGKGGPGCCDGIERARQAEPSASRSAYLTGATEADETGRGRRRS